MTNEVIKSRKGREVGYSMTAEPKFFKHSTKPYGPDFVLRLFRIAFWREFRKFGELLRSSKIMWFRTNQTNQNSSSRAMYACNVSKWLPCIVPGGFLQE